LIQFNKSEHVLEFFFCATAQGTRTLTFTRTQPPARQKWVRGQCARFFIFIFWTHWPQLWCTKK